MLNQLQHVPAWPWLAGALGLFLLGVAAARPAVWGSWWKVWADCTQNPQTGHYVAKDVFKFWFAFSALVYLFPLTAVAQIIFGVDLDAGPGLILALAAVGIQANKSVDTYLARKTRDGANHALTVDPAQAERAGLAPPLPLQNQAPADDPAASAPAPQGLVQP